jgi:hypothetical protein
MRALGVQITAIGKVVAEKNITKVIVLDFKGTNAILKLESAEVVDKFSFDSLDVLKLAVQMVPSLRDKPLRLNRSEFISCECLYTIEESNPTKDLRGEWIANGEGEWKELTTGVKLYREPNDMWRVFNGAIHVYGITPQKAIDKLVLSIDSKISQIELELNRMKAIRRSLGGIK